jgi:hypothetical protein
VAGSVGDFLKLRADDWNAELRAHCVALTGDPPSTSQMTDWSIRDMCDTDGATVMMTRASNHADTSGLGVDMR